MQALRYFAGAIDGDFTLSGHDPARGGLIGRWWRREISSRALFNAIYALPDTSKTKLEMRLGDWTEDQYIAARIANELMLSRADYAAAHDSTMNPKLLESPAQIAERERRREEQRSLHAFLHAQMTGQLKLPPRASGSQITDGALKRGERG